MQVTPTCQDGYQYIGGQCVKIEETPIQEPTPTVEPPTEIEDIKFHNNMQNFNILLEIIYKQLTTKDLKLIQGEYLTPQEYLENTQILLVEITKQISAVPPLQDADSCEVYFDNNIELLKNFCTQLGVQIPQLKG